MDHPFRLVVIGFALLVIGAVLPFLMIIKLLESTFFLNLVAVASSIGGLTVGFLGITPYFRDRK
jgi:hypothetical protein